MELAANTLHSGRCVAYYRVSTVDQYAYETNTSEPSGVISYAPLIGVTLILKEA